MLTEPERCSICRAPEPDGDYEGTLCRTCVESLVGGDGEDFVDNACEGGVE